MHDARDVNALQINRSDHIGCIVARHGMRDRFVVGVGAYREPHQTGNLVRFAAVIAGLAKSGSDLISIKMKSTPPAAKAQAIRSKRSVASATEGNVSGLRRSPRPSTGI